jgi:lipopolysaccharide transport system ATP-binding protein
MARIDDFRQRRKTIVFVSHSMSAVQQICQRAILIHEGKIIADGPADQVAASYEELLHQPVGARI